MVPLNDIADALFKGVDKAHRDYLKIAGYGAMGIPESFLQAGAAVSLASLYGPNYKVWLETTFNRIGLLGYGNQRLDIVVVRKRAPNFVPRVIVEVKKSASPNVVAKDLKRLNNIKQKINKSGKHVCCILLCYLVANKSDSLSRSVELLHEDGQVTKQKFFFEKPRKTLRKRQSPAFYQTFCFRV